MCACIFRLQRLVKDLLKQLQGQDSGQWVNNKVSGLDRTLGEISRILEKQVEQQTTRIDVIDKHFYAPIPTEHFSFTQMSVAVQFNVANIGAVLLGALCAGLQGAPCFIGLSVD